MLLSFFGVRTSGVILSLYRTAEANGLDPVKYLVLLFNRVPNLSAITDKALDELLPWKTKVHQLCQTPYKNTK